MKLLILSIFVVATTLAADWNGLRVTWGINPLSSFKWLPRTTQEAKQNGWEQTSKACEGNTLGFRYMLKGDTAVMLLFDVNGFIAGIQAGIPNNQPNYPSSAIAHYFQNEGNMKVITAYFVPTSKICSSGRTAAEFQQQGTGSQLAVQIGNDPKSSSSLDMIPMTQDKQSGTQWTKGMCFWTMGLHYWYNLSKNMNCDQFRPLFLLYNKGKLNSFGWAFMTDLKSQRYEHPTPSVVGNFMKPVPQCIADYTGVLSTQHIFFTNSPRSGNRC